MHHGYIVSISRTNCNIVFFYFRLQLETTEAVRCWINDTEVHSTTDRIEVKFTTIREGCNFTIAYSSVSPEAECRSVLGDSESFQCLIEDLTPGTSFDLGIISKTDGERQNVSVQTGKPDDTY